VHFEKFKIWIDAIEFVLNIFKHFESFVKRFKKFCPLNGLPNLSSAYSVISKTHFAQNETELLTTTSKNFYLR